MQLYYARSLSTILAQQYQAMAKILDSKEYVPLPGDDSPERFTPIELRNHVQQNEDRARILFRILIGIIAALSTTIVVLSIRLWYLPVPVQSENGVTMKFHPYDFKLNIETPKKPCGETPAEAVERGCYFDHVRTQWLPQACNDPELNELFLQAVEHIPFYRDKEHTIQIPVTDMAWDEADDIVYSTVDYHRHHCAFALIKFHRAVMAGAKVDSYLDVGHSTHCALWLMNNTRPWEEFSIATQGSGFPDCKTLEEMRQFERGESPRAKILHSICISLWSLLLPHSSPWNNC
jgi:hypothetical protein